MRGALLLCCSQVMKRCLPAAWFVCGAGLGRNSVPTHCCLCAPRCLQGTLLPVPLQKEASVRLTASCSTLLGGSPVPVSADYANLADASEALPQLAGAACRLAAESYCSAMRLQVRSVLGLPPCLLLLFFCPEPAACQYLLPDLCGLSPLPAVDGGRGGAAVD